MDLTNTIIFLSAFANLFLGLLIYSKGSKKLINITYAVLAISIFAWSIGMVGFRAAYDPGVALIWCRFLYAAAIIMGGSFLYFTFVFPRNRFPSKSISFLIVVGHLLFFILMLFSDLFITDVIIRDNFEHVIIFSNYYYYIYPSLISIAFLWGYINLLVKRSRNKGIVKYQLTLVFLGAFLSSSFGMFTNLILPSFGVFTYNWLAQILALIMAGCIAYAIIRYRFMDIRLIISRLYIYTLIGVFTYVFYFIFAMVSEYFMGGVMNVRSWTLGGVFAFIYAIVFIPLLNRVQESSDVLFYRGYNPQRIFKDLALRLSSVIQLDQVLKILSFEFKKVLETEDLNVILFNIRERKVGKKMGLDVKCLPVFGRLEKLKKKKDIKMMLCETLVKSKKMIIRDELDDKKDKDLIKELVKYKIEIATPLITRSKTRGMILLGDKISKSSYSKEDIDFLEVIGSQAAVAIENARLYKEVGDFSKNLQRKVGLQTKDIKNKQEKLQKLLSMRSEFLDITSHQLRTPVSVIKGVLSMLDEGSVPKSKVKEFMNMAFNKSLKLEQIVDEILRASEMDSERFKLELSPVDIVPLVSEIYAEKKFIAKKNNVELILNLPIAKELMVMSDLKYIKHVIINLVNNSLQYTPKGSITINLRKTGGNAIIEVIDTGIGIPKKDISKLYKKFSRANNAKETFTDGSGLGLYIIRQIIEAHRGASVKIKNTKINKGTAMEVILPLIKNK